MNILVAGGTGFVGRHLVPALLRRGHRVRVMTRHPGYRADGAVDVEGDVGDPESLVAAMADIDAAYYLVHTLDKDDFVERDRVGAINFADQAARSGVDRIVYLGGLGNDDDDLSAHLRSRREVEEILTARVPTVSLRAGIVVGDGSVSWEILCQLIERLPLMITPRWVQTKTQPIALDDIVEYLVRALDLEPGGYYEVGAPESMTYKQMLQGAAKLMGRKLHILPVPILTPALSSHWLRVITDVDLKTARSLVDSMTNEVVVTDRRIEDLTGHQPMSFRDAARIALEARADRKRRENATDEPAAISS
ncbi:MAG: NAD(P)H-binding protein [Ilumatobacteraceae bacterium]